MLCPFIPAFTFGMHTSIADFHIVSVENFVEFVGFRKVLVGKI